MKPLELISQGKFIGEEFVLWLWMRGLSEGGTSGVENDNSAMFVDDAVVLSNERGEVKELSLKKGNPAESREAFEALSRGMRVCKAKMRLLENDQEWVFTLNSGTLEMSGMRLPPSSAKDQAGRVADRLFLLEEGAAHLERRFGAFLRARMDDGDTLLTEIQAWIRAGLISILEPVEVE